MQNGKSDQHQNGLESIKMTHEDFWKKEVANMQLQLHNSYIRIKELSDENDNLKKQLNESQLEFDLLKLHGV